MNKAELVSAMATDTGMKKINAQKAINSFISVVTKALKDNEKVTLIGFGTFSVTNRSARQGINPSTKQKIKIAAKKTAKFKPGANLNESIK